MLTLVLSSVSEHERLVNDDDVVLVLTETRPEHERVNDVVLVLTVETRPEHGRVDAEHGVRPNPPPRPAAAACTAAR